MSQIFIILSWHPDAKVFPSGLNATVRISVTCPLSSLILKKKKNNNIEPNICNKYYYIIKNIYEHSTFT